MKVLITGATSTIGIALAHAHVEDDLVLCARVGSRIGVLPHSAEVRYCYLEEPQSFYKAIVETKPDVVYHLSWYGSVREREEVAQVTLNVPASLAIASACCEVGASLVFAGSLAEKDMYESPYTVAKTCAARLMGTMCTRSNVAFTHARIGTVYGPYDDERHLIPKLLRGKEVVKMTDGEERYDYIFVDDAASALKALAGHGGVYDVGMGVSRSLRQVVEFVSATVDWCEVEWGALPNKNNHHTAFTYPIYRDTRWVPRVSFLEGVQRTIEHLESQ